MEQFEQLLTCAICLDRYRNPKLLPCQHSFCMEPCMDGLVDYVRRQVKCPECRAEHRIPYQGVQAFPTNVTLQRFLELHIEITGELPDPTSGQTMERCGVCSEKSYCALCVHCEKKCCPECKDAHMDILRREITRINSQVRRGLHRLQDALALVEKNTLGLQTNCASVAEEVDEIYRRLSKALKDRTEHLRNEVDRYLGTELRGLIQLKENLELEIANIQSNCDLAEAHINENVPWDDAELLDTKELFLRTVEFIRNFEYEAGDYSRRVRFVMAHDPNQLVLHMAGYGELNIKPESGSGGLLGSSSSLAPPGGSPGLMRSKSDHRLASQYRQQEEERLARNRYVPEYEYDAPEYEVPRNKSRYRSRFMRHRDGDDSDGDSRSTVRFTSERQEPSALRERVLDTEDAARGPLSGIFRLTDSPRVMKKLQECERAGKRKKEDSANQQTVVQQPQPPKSQSVAENPNVSYRRRSQQLNISGTTLRRILKQDLHMFPYKVQLTQRLLETDKPRRLAYANNVSRMKEAEPDFWERILMTDEAHFTLSGAVNKQNCRMWGTDNPHIIHETPLHDEKVTVWAGVCSKTIIGPFFFRAGETVNGDRYRWMLAHFVLPQMREKGLKEFWFQQDGATCHTARSTMDYLRRKFPGRVISKEGDIDWPPRSPDLTAPDFFLWGFLKSKVYANKPKTIDELKNNIRAEIAAISPETLANTMENAEKRAHFCLSNKGGHLIDVVFGN